jgi:hypothetical protein
VRLARAQLVAESIPHDVAALAGVGVRFEVLETFVQHLSVPVRYRNLMGRGNDAFPQQLHVIDLVFDSELVESMRWDRNKWSPWVYFPPLFRHSTAVWRANRSLLARRVEEARPVL